MGHRQAAGREVARTSTTELHTYAPESVVRAVGADWSLQGTGLVVQAVFLPSFDPELVLTLSCDEQTLRADTACCSLWELHHRRVEPFARAWLGVAPPQPWRVGERIAFDGEDARRFEAMALAAADGTGPADVLPRPARGSDDVSVMVRVRARSIERVVEVRYPRPDVETRPAIDPLLDRLLELAGRARDERLAEVVGSVRSHLG